MLVGLTGCGGREEKMTEEQARKIAEKTCIKGGEALGSGSYNPNSKTWWFDANLNSVREGCNPACVVNQETKKAEINWRCTGLYKDENQDDNFSFSNKQLDIAVREYLRSQEDFCWQTVEGSEKICVFERLDSNQLFPHYLWVRCGEFTKNGDKVEENSGSSLPVMIDYPNELSFFDQEKFSHKIPRDGSLYLEDIKDIFPGELQNLVLEYDPTKINEEILVTAKAKVG